MTRTLYATDASIYRAMPIGVVMPKSAADVVSVCRYADERRIPILPRGAGTSLAGQAVNHAIVLDFTRYMNRILHIDPQGETVDVEPGVVLAELNQALLPYGLKFAPDPASGNRSAVGGAIGNNASGAHSLVYGMTDAYVEEVDVVLADGTPLTFVRNAARTANGQRAAPWTRGPHLSHRWRRARKVRRRDQASVSRSKAKCERLQLSRLVQNGALNLSRLITGSEGTLGVVVRARLRLVPVPKATSMVLLSYSSLADAMEDVYAIVGTGAAAVEVMDDIMLDLAGRRGSFPTWCGGFRMGTSSVLIVEYYGDGEARGPLQGRGPHSSLCRSGAPIDTHPVGKAAAGERSPRFTRAAPRRKSGTGPCERPDCRFCSLARRMRNIFPLSRTRPSRPKICPPTSATCRLCWQSTGRTHPFTRMPGPVCCTSDL